VQLPGAGAPLNRSPIQASWSATGLHHRWSVIQAGITTKAELRASGLARYGERRKPGMNAIGYEREIEARARRVAEMIRQLVRLSGPRNRNSARVVGILHLLLQLCDAPSGQSALRVPVGDPTFTEHRHGAPGSRHGVNQIVGMSELAEVLVLA
jgi:hypothetical protein